MIRHRTAFGPRAALALALSTAACGPAPAPLTALEHSRAQAPSRGAPGEGTAPMPDPSSAREVSLASLLAFADRHSPLLAVAESTRSRAEAARVAASLVLQQNPELSVAAGPRTGSAGTGLDVTVELMQELELGGERGARRAAAQRLSELTDAEIEQVRWALHCDVRSAFRRARVEHKRVRLGERTLAFQEEVLRIAERQVAAGETAQLSLRLARAEVAQARQSVVALRQTFVASRIRLAILTGWPVATPPLPGGAADAVKAPPGLGQLLVESRERLPSLRVGAARVREAQARAALAGRQRSLRPSVGVRYDREGARGSDDTQHAVMGVVSLPLPAFQTNQGERARARADAVVANAELGAARRLLEGEIAAARSEVVAAAERVRTYEGEVLPRFEENLGMLRRSFELGEVDLLSLSAGRERFLRIQSDALAAELDYFAALSTLERWVGVEL
ncbi:MAG: TolC family protein [Polyangiaceae bacterium]|nr:TolC family protein [Polyangiaceae bacterium]